MHVRELGTIDYLEAWELQRELATARADETGPDTLLLLEHPSVYTAGKRTEPDERPDDGTPVVDVDRGGKITWHGPGQLVGYPIVKLADPIDVVQYVRRVEQALIAVCDELGVRHGPRRGPQRRVAGRRRPPAGTQDRRHRHPRAARRDHARLRDQLRRRPARLRPHHPVRHPRRRRDLPVGRTRPGGHVAEVLPLAEKYVLAALEGDLPVEDRWLPRWTPTSPGVNFELAQR